MVRKHSQNNGDRSHFTYEERRQLHYGTLRERLGKESIKDFDACCLCLQTVNDPVCCHKGHIFCKECILECLLAQKKDIKRQQAAFEAQGEVDRSEQQRRLHAAKERELVEFERANNGATPLSSVAATGKPIVRGNGDGARDLASSRVGSGSIGAAGVGVEERVLSGATNVKSTQFEEEALRTMRAFWLPSQTPEAETRVAAPRNETVCPEGSEKLKLKQLFAVNFDDDVDADGAKGRRSGIGSGRFRCPSCKDTLTNTSYVMVASGCGHAFCKNCATRFVTADKSCLSCGKAVRDKELIALARGGTGFAATNGEVLKAASFAHLGHGSTRVSNYKPGKTV